MPDPTRANVFKDEGNALFAKKEYAAAYEKYTDAIREDGTNAVLYANRAACSLNMKSYLDAVDDSEKATEIDPKYSKAWGRLATAAHQLALYSKSAEAFEEALGTLPQENLSPAEVRLKKQYEDGLNAAREAETRGTSGEHLVVSRGGLARSEAPFLRAMAMKEELIASGEERRTSSAWVILGAYQEFSEGVQIMKQLYTASTPDETFRSALDGLANGILRDERAFYMDSPHWTKIFNRQVLMEIHRYGAWTKESTTSIIEEALKLQREKGWDFVRPALSTTVRGFIMRGFLGGGLHGDYGPGVEYIGRALEILDWGRKAWKDVPIVDKGTIFSDTFTRGVRRLHIQTLMQAVAKTEGGMRELLESLLARADEILRDLDTNPAIPWGEHDPGFVSSFYIYPRGEALAIKGFYHRERTRAMTSPEREDYIRKAADFYLQAAEVYPEDDENHVWYLKTSLDHLWHCGTPLSVTLPMLERIRLGAPKIRKIWEHSSLALQGRDKSIRSYEMMEEDIRAGLARGEFSMDQLLMPGPPM
ncbi:hypothetical protein BOTBODRAFT_27211 [Botryobasidium botryosum FD-172 SS1]|uniref:Uncharacterized protein n=1 Tax=Botryobasidium botryosum (strain FD-172 SS1) TaxID=930990 RepID=A0A067N7P2_BOTB1|nr:hypothetical protein BOTBODRAFT_27211 [Botryobasidium botryosum FD-172 SS1]